MKEFQARKNIVRGLPISAIKREGLKDLIEEAARALAATYSITTEKNSGFLKSDEREVAFDERTKGKPRFTNHN